MVLREALLASLLVWSAPCSVEDALEIATDHRQVAFGRMQLGEEKVLAQFASSHNRVICASTNGQTWYLKISVIQPLASGAETIPLEALTWQLASTSGHGTVVNGHAFSPFRLIPETVYISGPGEADGVSVSFDFRYALTIPTQQLSGIYQTTVRFTFTELL
ncbi:MAG: hypothetical protein HYZ91_07205 [Candidatus Omnitrophica bacterium]|nr:hypothetical protein [Candidatus Omnitrophota bacterium]